MADGCDRLAGLHEGPGDFERGGVAAQRRRRLAAGEDEQVVGARIDVAERRIDLDLVAVLAMDPAAGEGGDVDREPGFLQPVERAQQFGVLEVVGADDQGFHVRSGCLVAG